MNEVQKRYTIEKIEKYKDEVNDIKKKITNETIFSAMSAMAVCCGLLSDVTLVQLLSIVNAGILINNIKDMIVMISRKAGLENQISNLEYNLEMSAMENSKYMGR